jgi:hypothetical protein
MHNVQRVLVLVPVQAQHQKHALPVAVVVLQQTIRECFRSLSRVVRVAVMASSSKTHVQPVGEPALNVALAK